MTTLFFIWNLSPEDLGITSSKKISEKISEKVFKKRLILANKYLNEEKLNRFDKRILTSINNSEQKEELKDLNLFDLIKFLEIKFSFSELDDIDYDTLMYINSKDRIHKIKIDVSILLNTNRNMKDKYKNIFNNKNYINNMTNSKTLEEGYQSLKVVKCKFNDKNEDDIVIDPITREILEEDNLEMNGRCYNRSTIRELIRTGGKDPFTRGSIPSEIRELFVNRNLFEEEEFLDANEEVIDLSAIIVDLSDQDINEMPITFGIRTKTLYLDNNSIQVISLDWDPKNIKMLSLTNNEITNIPQNWDSKNIEEIYLSYNPISLETQVDIRNRYPNIEFEFDFEGSEENRDYNNENLDLIAEELEEIPTNFGTNILQLDLDTNNIQNIPLDWDPKNILNLYLTNNRISNIPIGWDSKNIELIDLRNNNISPDIYSDIRNRYPNIRIVFENEDYNMPTNNILNLRHLSLTEMPTNFDMNTTKLILSGNNITNIPLDWDPKNIQKLYLYGNSITNIPVGWDPKNIKKIILEANPVSEETQIDIINRYPNIKFIFEQHLDANEEVINLSSRTVDLSEQDIYDIPRNFGSRTKNLDLSNNRIQNIPLNWDPKNIKKLNLSGNIIDDIPVGWDSKNIEEINLEYNPILPENVTHIKNRYPNIEFIFSEYDDEEGEEESISGGTILNLSNLTEMPTDFGDNVITLCLTGNRISNIPLDWDPKNITELYLDENNITNIPVGWNSKNIESIILIHNNISQSTQRDIRNRYPNIFFDFDGDDNDGDDNDD